MEQVRIDIEVGANIQNLNFDMKSRWPELDFDDLRFAAKRIYAQDEEIHLANGELFTQLVNLPTKELRSLTEKMMLDDDGVQALVNLYDAVEFVIDKRPVFSFSRCYEYRGFTGPADELANIQWQQFAKAERYYSQYLADLQESDLNALLGFIYWKDQFSLDLAPKMMKIVQAWPIVDRKAMFFNYMALRNFMLEIPEVVEPLPEKERDPIQALQNAVEAPDPHSAEKFAFRLAGAKFGTVHQINQMMVPDVFRMIDQLKEEQE